MFGSYRKLCQTEIVFCVDRKIGANRRKIIYVLIFPTNNFRKSHLKRESSSTLLTQSKTHIQAHLSQASASPDRAAPWSKTHLQAYLQTISRKKKKKRTKPRSRRESRAGEIANTTTPDRTTASNPSTHHNPRSHHRIQSQIAPLRPTLDRTVSLHPSTCEIAPLTHPCSISLFLDLPRPFPQLSITLFLPLSPFDRIFEFNECFDLIFVSFKFIY